METHQWRIILHGFFNKRRSGARAVWGPHLLTGRTSQSFSQEIVEPKSEINDTFHGSFIPNAEDFFRIDTAGGRLPHFSFQTPRENYPILGKSYITESYVQSIIHFSDFNALKHRLCFLPAFPARYIFTKKFSPEIYRVVRSRTWGLSVLWRVFIVHATAAHWHNADCAKKRGDGLSTLTTITILTLCSDGQVQTWRTSFERVQVALFSMFYNKKNLDFMSLESFCDGLVEKVPIIHTSNMPSAPEFATPGLIYSAPLRPCLHLEHSNYYGHHRSAVVVAGLV